MPKDYVTKTYLDKRLDELTHAILKHMADLIEIRLKRKIRKLGKIVYA